MNKYLSLGIIFLYCTYLNSMDIKNLTLDQKIGQLFMVAAVIDENIAQDFMHNKPYRMDKEYIQELITKYHIGGIIYLGKSDKDKQIKRTQEFQNISAIPLLIGQDLEPGRIGKSRFDDFDFPTPKELGKINNTKYTYHIGKNIGAFCRKVSVHINFAPVADVNNNPKNPVINNRSFSNHPDIVAKHAIALARGLCHSDIVPCAKHFPGHGDTEVDSHYDLPLIKHDRNRLNNIELYPFKELIKAEIPAIMIAHLTVPALESQENLPATLSKTIVTDILQKELGFTGLIITDGLDMQAITKHYSEGQAELLALLAGNDILLCPVDVPTAIAKIKEAIAEQRITEPEVDAHVEKILAIKKQFFNC